METITRKPYRDELLEKHGTTQHYIVRRIPSKTSQDELIYERDSAPHKFNVLSGYNWKLEYKDRSPVALEVGQQYPLSAKQSYRWLKGDGDLIIRIENI